MVNNELGLLLDHMDTSRGKIFWRSFGLTVASSTPSMVWLDPKAVECEGDRVLSYFSTWIVHLKVRGPVPVGRIQFRAVIGTTPVARELVCSPKRT